MQRTLVTVPPAISMVALIGTHDDKLRIILEKWEWLKNDEKFLEFINK